MDRTLSLRTAVGWAAVAALVLVIILVPFFLFEADVNHYIEGLIGTPKNRSVLAWTLGGFLAADVFLPVPSSLVSTAAGGLFGFPGGALVSWIGMTAGCLLGYFVGLKAGPPVVRGLAGQKELERVERAQRRYGVWAIILFRAVPVMAEASVLFAGMARVKPGLFLLLTSLSNLGISLVYAAVGSFSAGADSFLLAFAGAIMLPAGAMGLIRLVESVSRQTS